MFIHKACKYRLPEKFPVNGPVKLRPITPESGWLTDTGGVDPDSFPPAPYNRYRGDKSRAYWFFDKEMALAAVKFCGDRKKRQKQMLTFIQDGEPLPVAKQGFAPLKFEPDTDGLSFSLEGGFLSQIPEELTGAGTPLGHAPGLIKFSVIKGPAVQTGPNTFRIQFDRAGTGGDLWIQEEHPGNSEFRHAVQPGKMVIPARLSNGDAQKITFPEIGNVALGTRSIQLKAISSSNLPVGYYVVSGPAVVDGNTLQFTEIPVRSRLPIKVIIVAYQWGRTIEPLWQSAEPVERTFYIIRN